MHPNEQHIRHTHPEWRDTSRCGLPLEKDEPAFESADQALNTMAAQLPLRPCRACVSAVCTQLNQR